LIQENVDLAGFTSFGVGGPAAKLITIDSPDDISSVLKQAGSGPIWALGYGTNVLISDTGLPGTVLLFRHKGLELQDGLVIAEAGLWWDDLVQTAIDKNLWGLELTSGVPGSVGAAVFINITAYGQSQSDRLVWIEYVDIKTRQTIRLEAKDLTWDYKQSIFQAHDDWLIIRAAYQLRSQPTSELTYQSALDAAEELGLSPDSLINRRKIILLARQRAGSLFVPNQGYAKTVGSFFRNPLVDPEQAQYLMGFDETGKSRAQIAVMNRVHGGNETRISAAHVLLAAGFSRGQSWGDVRLHPMNVLKIENTGNASAQDIYEVSQEIIKTVKSRLAIDLVPEARILGQFY